MKSTKFPFPLVVLTITCLFAVFLSNAQILNIEKTRAKGDTTNVLTGRFAINFYLFNRDAGENDPNNYLNLVLNSNLIYFSERHAYLLLGKLNYVAVTENPVISTGYAHFRVNFMSHQRFSYEGFSQIQYDRSRGLRDRWLVGGGIRYKIAYQTKDKLNVGVGIMFESENWNDPKQENVLVNPNLIKVSNYIGYETAITDQIKLNSIAYYQAGYDSDINAFRHRLSGDLRLLISLSKVLSLNINFNGVYENRPIIPITKFIYSLTNGITFKF